MKESQKKTYQLNQQSREIKEFMIIMVISFWLFKEYFFPQSYEQRLLICIDGQYSVGILLFILILWLQLLGLSHLKAQVQRNNN